MNKLLSAGFARLKKDKFFWVCVGLMAAVAWYTVFTVCLNRKEYDGYNVGLDAILFGHVFCMGILTAAFSGLFIGTEYSGGTIRNKLVIGHTRRDIYLSSLIISITAGLIICLSYILAAMIPGLILLGFSEGVMGEMLQVFFLILLMTAAFSAVFTMLSMLNQNKALNCVIVLIGVFVMLMFSAYIFQSLDSPEMWEEYVYVDEETGEIVTEPAEPNPFYVSGIKREVYEFLMQFLPTGQSYLIMTGDLSHGKEMAAYSVFIIIGSSVAGMYCFRRKDIK